jgi:hypothetical protein
MQSEYYPDCYEPIVALQQSKDKFVSSVVKGAVAGAIIGGLAGLLIGGNARGGAIGAGAGAAAGGMGGYFVGKRNQFEKDQERYGSYLADVNKDLETLDRTHLYAMQAQECYDLRFDQALADFRAGKVSRQELGKRYEEIRKGMEEVNAILGDMADQADENRERYVEAMANENQAAGYSPPEYLVVPADQASEAEMEAAVVEVEVEPVPEAKASQTAAAEPQPAAEPQASKPQTSQLVLNIQTELVALGYDPGPTDGVWGAKTQSALAEFLQKERLHQLEPKADAQVLMALRAVKMRKLLEDDTLAEAETEAEAPKGPVVVVADEGSAGDPLEFDDSLDISTLNPKMEVATEVRMPDLTAQLRARQDYGEARLAEMEEEMGTLGFEASITPTQVLLRG